MISYPLYASPEGRTPFDEYKNEANGVPELNPIEAEVLSCYKKYEDAVNNGIVHTLRPHGFVQPEKGNLQNLYSSDCDVAKKVPLIMNLQEQNGGFIIISVLIVYYLSPIHLNIYSQKGNIQSMQSTLIT